VSERGREHWSNDGSMSLSFDIMSTLNILNNSYKNFW
jgi:hypothetical protein